MQPDQTVIARWTGSAPYWEKHRASIKSMFAPFTQALVEAAHIDSGDSVLDVATGPGEPALTVAELVGPHGQVFGVDPIPEMIAAAGREASRLQQDNCHFEAAFADHLPFPGEMFDAVISRFGVMFFPSPLDALRELLRVLKPGKKLAFAVWCPANKNPLHSSLSRVVDTYIESPPPAPDALEPFRFAAPGRLQQILHQAGVAGPTERLLQCRIHAALPIEDYLEMRLELSDKLHEKVASLPEPRKAALKRDLLESIREYANRDGITFPAEVLIVSGTKPNTPASPTG